MHRRTRSIAHQTLVPSLALLGAMNVAAGRAPQSTPAPIMFVTQVPVPNDGGTIAAAAGSHAAGTNQAIRGGALLIRYPDGTLKDLTAAAGLGQVGFQGAQSIAVRDPAIHWSGTKALFSMVVGAPSTVGDITPYRWQMYEVLGLGQADTPLIYKVPNQPQAFNNVSPIYASDDRILFTSDRPRGGLAHLYPQKDEYDNLESVSGIWSLDPFLGDIFPVTSSPSGEFTPYVDSFGRVVFTRWDHLQRDQRADADNLSTTPI